MVMTALFAFLHHFAAFALVAALTVEFVLIRDAMTLQTARKLLAADLVFGIAAGAVLVVGLLRVLYFEGASSYYFQSVPFISKLALFVVIGLLSIYPTVTFLSWRPAIRQGRAPDVDARKIKSIRAVIHLELMGIVLLILCAALTARGIGYFR